uniref:Uncharacterized protein n=1 Tax=Arundo donax TaxID=35708 RepID=A0A0A9AJ97_ARUDO
MNRIFCTGSLTVGHADHRSLMYI